MTFKQALLRRLLVVAPYFFLAAFFFALPTLVFHVESQEGKLLVATDKVDSSPAFGKSVIYIVHHDWAGATGVVINKPGFGGPVDPQTAYVLHSGKKGRLVLEEADAATPSDGPVLQFKGRSEWGYRQLGKEISEGFWVVRPYSADLIFNLHPELVWENARKELAVPDSH